MPRKQAARHGQGRAAGAIRRNNRPQAKNWPTGLKFRYYNIL